MQDKVVREVLDEWIKDADKDIPEKEEPIKIQEIDFENREKRFKDLEAANLPDKVSIVVIQKKKKKVFIRKNGHFLETFHFY